MSGIEDRGLRPVITRLGAPGLVAAALILGAVVATGAMLPGLISALLVPSPSPVSLSSDAAQDQAARMENFRKQVDGRTMFFVPAKPPPAPPVVEASADDDGPPPPPPPVSTYGGPAPIAMIFDTVWFADGQKLKSGGEAKGDLQVVRLEAPWDAVLKWKGVEFSVKVFERDSVVLRTPGQKMAEGTPAELKPAPPPEAAPPVGAPVAPPGAAGQTPTTAPADTPPADPPPAPPPADPENNP